MRRRIARVPLAVRLLCLTALVAAVLLLLYLPERGLPATLVFEEGKRSLFDVSVSSPGGPSIWVRGDLNAQRLVITRAEDRAAPDPAGALHAEEGLTLDVFGVSTEVRALDADMFAAHYRALHAITGKWMGRSYRGATSADGTRWQVSLMLNNGANKTSGTDAYPDNWEQLALWLEQWDVR